MAEKVFVITEKQDVGGRDTVYAQILSTESVYGGDLLPFFTKRSDANDFLAMRADNYRSFEITELKGI